MHLVDGGVAASNVRGVGRHDPERCSRRRVGRRLHGCKLFEDTKPLAEGLEPINGLGDEAFFGAVAGMQVSVLKGDVYLSVTVPFGTTEGDAATVRALAPLAVGRLP